MAYELTAVCRLTELKEKYIAIKNGHLTKHMKKWHPQEEPTGEASLNDFIEKYVKKL